jgi:transposase-like protein
LAVRWYLQYGLSYRDIEELFAERGVEVYHVSIYPDAGGRRAIRADARAGSARRIMTVSAART